MQEGGVLLQLKSHGEIKSSLVLGLDRVRSWRDTHRAFFDVIRADPRINTECWGNEYIHNGYYPTPDAEAYAAMILENRPARIVEVGSRFSALIARKTVEKAGIATVIEVIDPSPRTEVRDVADRLILKHVEDTEMGAFDFTAGCILFIDSSHICRAGGDIPFLFCRVIPSLPAGVIVHVHDIFLPYDYPIAYQRRLYTEQYVLHALLGDSARYEILLATHYMSRTHPAEMQATFGSIVARHDSYFGASFWFKTR